MSDDFFEALDAIVYLVENGGENADDALDLEALQAKLTAVAGTAEEGLPRRRSRRARVERRLQPRATSLRERDAERRCGGEASEAAQPTRSRMPSPTRRWTTRMTTRASRVCRRPRGGDEVHGSAHRRRATPATELKAKTQTTIRIRTEQVDRLLNLISETVIAQIKSEQRLSELRMQGNELAETWSGWQRLRAELVGSGRRRSDGALETTLNSVDSLLVGVSAAWPTAS